MTEDWIGLVTRGAGGLLAVIMIARQTRRWWLRRKQRAKPKP
jgi:hypothetical protein